MQIYLLKHVERKLENIVVKVRSSSLKPSIQIRKFSAILFATFIQIVYAQQPLEDTHRDSKSIVANADSTCTTDNVAVSIGKSADKTVTKQLCNNENYFIDVVNTKSPDNPQPTATADKYAVSPNGLLQGVLDKIHVLGGTDATGKSISVANEDIPVLFGSQKRRYVVTSVTYTMKLLDDAELESNYIEVKIKPVCITKNLDDSSDKRKSSDEIDTTKILCRDENYFVDVTDNKVPMNSLDTSKSDDSNNNPLIASIFNNIRLLGGTDVLGVPSGVANTGVPLFLGSENYSYAFSGNLNQIFQPSTVPFYNSVYDTSSLGYGFNEEVHFPNGIPRVSIQSYSTR
jgi:hypothetical protein